MPRILSTSKSLKKLTFTECQLELFKKEYLQFHKNITEFLIAKNALRITETGKVLVVSMPLELYCKQYALDYGFDTSMIRHCIPKLLWEALMAEALEH